MFSKCLLVSMCAVGACAAVLGQAPSEDRPACECGAHPPAPPVDLAVTPYAGEPADLRPFSKFAEPYDVNYIHPNIYSGAARDIPDPTNVTEVRIGFLGPIENHPQQEFGLRMLHGAQMAVDEANARGGFGGKPFRLMLHNDYDNWQAGTVYGDQRPTDSTIWGSASDEVVKMVFDDQDWAIFGSISSESTHIALRVALRAEIPIVNSASTDPTIPETYIPWYFTDLQDDRVQAYTLARRIFTELGLKRAALLRVNERYGRFGAPYFRNAARRLGHPVVIEQKYMPGDMEFTRQLRVIQSSRADAIVVWGDEKETAEILREMRKLGMKQRVFGSHRTLGETLLKSAGEAAEGFEAVFPYDATRSDPKWVEFEARYATKYGEPGEQFAALAYDAMNQLLDSICKAGLNRARIHDALARIGRYDGVTGSMVYDPNLKNVSPMFLGTVHDGAITYRRASMEAQGSEAASMQNGREKAPANGHEEPYARVSEDGVSYNGPRREVRQTHANAEPVRIVVFGPDAAAIADAAKASVSGGPGDATRWEFVPIESAQSWGNASAQLVEALMESHPLAMVALDRNAAHLAEQLALKTFVPVVAISDDRTLTSTNVPWIFRLPASTQPGAAFSLIEAAYQAGGRDPDRLRMILASGREVGGVAFAPTGEPAHIQ